MKTVLISGATGLVGGILAQRLTEKGYEVRILSRKKSANHFIWDLKEKKIEDSAFENLDAIIHLAGAPVSKKWSESYKEVIYKSRVDSSKLLFEYVKKLNVDLKTFITASGINYYGTLTSDKIFTETDPPSTDFFGKVCVDWENAAFDFESLGTRVCSVRTSVVLSTQGGMLKELLPITKLNLLSPLGTGKQILPWIHVDDLVNMYIYLLENKKLSGAFNAAAPQIVTQKEFTKIWAQSLHKKVILPHVPSFALKLIFGEMASILLKGSAISSKKIQKSGFTFQYNDLKNALKDLLERNQ